MSRVEKPVGFLLALRISLHITTDKSVLDITELMEPESELPQVIEGLHADGSLAALLDGWNKESNEHGKNGDHHNQLKQAKSFSYAHLCSFNDLEAAYQVHS